MDLQKIAKVTTPLPEARDSELKLAIQARKADPVDVLE
jgi:hypothetical protein